jgi:SNF family Na+-dependent transporter
LLRGLWRGAKPAVAAGIGCLVLCGVAWGQIQKPPAPDATTAGGAYVMAYCLLVVCIAMGLLVVCRSSGRRDRARPEQYAEAKLGVKEEKKSGK